MFEKTKLIRVIMESPSLIQRSVYKLIWHEENSYIKLLYDYIIEKKNNCYHFLAHLFMSHKFGTLIYKKLFVILSFFIN